MEEEEEGRTGGTKGIKDTMRTRSTESAVWDSSGLTEIREPVGDELKSSAYVL